jgi:hypothetical protein
LLSGFVANVTASSTDYYLTLLAHTLASCVSMPIPVSYRSTVGKVEGTPVATELCYPQTYTLQMRSVGAQFIKENWTDASPPLTPRVALCPAHHSAMLQMWLAPRLGTIPLLRHASSGSLALSVTLAFPHSCPGLDADSPHNLPFSVFIPNSTSKSKLNNRSKRYLILVDSEEKVNSLGADNIGHFR